MTGLENAALFTSEFREQLTGLLKDTAELMKITGSNLKLELEAL